MMLLAALLAQAVDRPPSIGIRKTGSGFRAEVPTFDVSWEAKVNGEIERQAAALCGDKQVDWGKFGSNVKVEKDPTKPTRVSGYFKEFSCIVPQERPVASISSDWKATEIDEGDVRRQFESYYTKRDAGDFEGSSAMLSADVKPDKSSYPRLREFNQALGKGSRRITGVTWYVNPASAPRLGAYAALDFIGEYTGMHLYCGYLILYRLGPGKYEITREEQNAFHRNDQPVDPAQLEQMRAATCRGN